MPRPSARPLSSPRSTSSRQSKPRSQSQSAKRSRLRNRILHTPQSSDADQYRNQDRNLPGLCPHCRGVEQGLCRGSSAHLLGILETGPRAQHHPLDRVIYEMPRLLQPITSRPAPPLPSRCRQRIRHGFARLRTVALAHRLSANLKSDQDLWTWAQVASFRE